MTHKKNSTMLDWLMKEKLKDKAELDFQKKIFISEIKKLRKEDLLPKKPKKLSLWMRIKKVLMG